MKFFVIFARPSVFSGRSYVIHFLFLTSECFLWNKKAPEGEEIIIDGTVGILIFYTFAQIKTEPTFLLKNFFSNPESQ